MERRDPRTRHDKPDSRRGNGRVGFSETGRSRRAEHRRRIQARRKRWGTRELGQRRVARGLALAPRGRQDDQLDGDQHFGSLGMVGGNDHVALNGGSAGAGRDGDSETMTNRRGVAGRSF